jgi:4'-phosphopantetheinyl transferase superfamily
MTALSPVASDLIHLEAGEDAPEVRLLDARGASLPETVLRRWARSQRQPDTGTFVTRSYRYPYALVAWHTAPVGVDLERIEPCPPGFAESISAPAERSAPPAGDDPDAYAISLWCAKEALAKALGDARRYDPRRLESPLRWPNGRCGPWRSVQLAAPAGHLAWLCWRHGWPVGGCWVRAGPSVQRQRAAGRGVEHPGPVAGLRGAGRQPEPEHRAAVHGVGRFD